jgi:hypothetical protein
MTPDFDDLSRSIPPESDYAPGGISVRTARSLSARTRPRADHLYRLSA